MGERTTDSLTSTGEINWEARSGFHERIKKRMEQKVEDQAKLISELKDELIDALKTRPNCVQPCCDSELNDNVGSLRIDVHDARKDNADLRQKLAAGLSAYQAEVKRADDLLVERGDYAAEVLNLKLIVDEQHKKMDEYARKLEDWESRPDKYKDHARALKAELHAVRENRDEILADLKKWNEQIIPDGEIIKAQRKTINGQNETIRKWNEQILEDGEIIKRQDDLIASQESTIKAWRPLIIASA